MGFGRRLYRGDTTFDFIGTRKRWYAASALLVLVCLLSMGFRGFNWGIEFSGGTSFTFNKPAGSSVAQVTSVIDKAGVEVQTAQEAGRGSQQKYVVKTASLSVDQTVRVKRALSSRFGMPLKNITDNQVSSSWGGQVTNRALIALVVFLVLVAFYLSFRFEMKMAIAALAALVHDLVLTAGVYSLVGFEVTPSTVVGLLTILGFSLYDTVVVFDRVAEDTRGLLSGARMTYGEAANGAVNETLMRSINTSLISLLPVAGLLFVGAGLLGVGTLKDLALVLFVGLAVGAYSSLFLATPWLVDMKEREPRYRQLRERIAVKRAKAATSKAPIADDEQPGTDTDGLSSGASADADQGQDEDAGDREVAGAASGARPPARTEAQRRRTGGKPGRPSGGRKRR